MSLSLDIETKQETMRINLKRDVGFQKRPIFNIFVCWMRGAKSLNDIESKKSNCNFMIRVVRETCAGAFNYYNDKILGYNNNLLKREEQKIEVSLIP